MIDPRIDKLADILVNYSVEVRPGDWVLIMADVLAMPLATEVVKHVTIAGGHPTLKFDSDLIRESFLRHANDEQLKWLSPDQELIVEKTDCSINVRASSNTRTLTGVDPQKQQLAMGAIGPIRQRIMERAAAGTYRWTVTQFPCEAYAHDADMSLRDYEDFVYAATFADQADPVACWSEIHDMQQKLVDWLEGKDKIEVRGPNIEMTLSMKDRLWINSDGKRNMPSGEIYTGPVEESVEGWVKFNYPAIREGREVEGVEFEFKEGKVVSAKAQKNEEYLLSQLDSDDGARYLGEFAVGTNYQIQRFTKSILYDEKIGGTLHMAVGAGYPDTGSKNRSQVHWDFICDMRTDSEILVDGELFYKNGEFQV